MLNSHNYNPDVLTCLANLSNDEVFTPPQLVNRILDLLPQELWSDKRATFLDPGCKSGVFLREIAKRLDKGLDDFRDAMLHDHRISRLVDYPKLYDGFPGVKIRGGVSYFLWERDYKGPCSVQTMWDGEPLGPPMKRRLDSYDVLVRRNEAVSILDKVRAYRVGGQPEPTLDKRVSSRKPFGLPTNFHGTKSFEELSNPVKLYGSQRISWVSRSDIQQNQEWIDDWKVLLQPCKEPAPRSRPSS